MGIIESTRAVRASRSPGLHREQSVSEVTANAKILDLALLEKYVNEVFGHHADSSSDHEGKRSWGYVWEMNLSNILGKVDEPTWVFMLESMIEWAIETHGAVQPNGRWRLSGWEVVIEDKVHVRRVTSGKGLDGLPKMREVRESRKMLVIGAEFVDVLGEEDLLYEMGRPRTRRGGEVPSGRRLEVSSSSLKEAESKLQAQAIELERLRADQGKTQEMMALLLSELQGLKDESG